MVTILCLITVIFTYIFNNCSSPSLNHTNFLKNDSSNLRLLTYNVLSNGLTSNNRIEKHRRIFNSVNADIITYQECGNTNYNDVISFLDTNSTYYPYIYPDLNSETLQYQDIHPFNLGKYIIKLMQN